MDAKKKHICEVYKGKGLSIFDALKNCQFQNSYNDLTQKHYSDFEDDFYEYLGKKYCVFHAPIEAQKISGRYTGTKKKGLYKGFPELEGFIQRLEKFENVIYGIINQKIQFFAEKPLDEKFRPSNEEQINLSGVVFPFAFTLTKDDQIYNYSSEYQAYAKRRDEVIPFLDLKECEFNGGITIESGPQNPMRNLGTGEITTKIYPSIVINGASFAQSRFKHVVEFIGIDFSPEKQLSNYGVWFDRANFECTSIKLDRSSFNRISFNDSKITSYYISFRNMLVHSEFEMSCKEDSSDEIKRVKSESIDFTGSSFGDATSYHRIRIPEVDNDGDLGGKIICQNRVFDCDVNFFASSFYQAPDFYGTRFNQRVTFSPITLYQSCYKYRYYDLFRSLRFEMSRKNLYREEAQFWRMEEKCLEKSTSSLNPIRFFLHHCKYSFAFLSKKRKAEKPDIIRTDQSFFERLFSKIFDIICKRGTSLNWMIFSIFWMPVVIFPTIYFGLSVGSEFFRIITDTNRLFLTAGEYITFLLRTLSDSFSASLLYTFDPFHKPGDQLKIQEVSYPIVTSYIQSICQVALYVIFGFMLKRRFRISG